MVIICEECGKVYKLDAEKLKNNIKGNTTKIKCRICDHVIHLTLNEDNTFTTDSVKPDIQQDQVLDNISDSESNENEKADELENEQINESIDDKDQTTNIKEKDKKKKKEKRKRQFVFGIRSKMLLMFLVIPVLLTIGLSFFSLKQMDNLASEITSQSTEVVKELTEKIIIDQAKSVASQCSIFLKNNPDLNKDDFFFDLDLNRISIQKVGLKGYTALIEIPSPDQSDDYFTIWCHPDQKLIGKSLLKSFKANLGDSYENFKGIINKIRLGKGNFGYYQWTEDGQIKDKFIAVEHIEQSKYIIISTTYIDDFTGPIIDLQKKSNQTTDETRNINVIICSFLILIIGMCIILYGYSLSKNIGKLTDAADRISIGELDVSIKISSKDEIGALADAIIRMQDSLRFSIERLRKRR